MERRCPLAVGRADNAKLHHVLEFGPSNALLRRIMTTIPLEGCWTSRADVCVRNSVCSRNSPQPCLDPPKSEWHDGQRQINGDEELYWIEPKRVQAFSVRVRAAIDSTRAGASGSLLSGYYNIIYACVPTTQFSKWRGTLQFCLKYRYKRWRNVRG